MGFPRLGVCGALILAVGAGCGGSHGTKQKPAAAAPSPTTGAAPWPAPPDPLARARRAGLTPRTHEFFAYHVHAHLDIFVNGTPEAVPAAIGMNIEDPAVHSAAAPDGTTEYGSISPPCSMPCISSLHTHSDDGVLHTESQRNAPNRLGAFFTEWSAKLTPGCVGGYCEPRAPIAFYVDGKPYAGDPRGITLTDRKEIAIVIGTPPDSIAGAFPQ
jgi:hypothetical protein